jgi:hypothetical protein
VPMAAVFRAVQKDRALDVVTASGRLERALYPFIRFPWGTAIGLVVLIPLVAATGAWIATAVAQRTRPLRGATFGTD